MKCVDENRIWVKQIKFMLKFNSKAKKKFGILRAFLNWTFFVLKTPNELRSLRTLRIESLQEDSETLENTLRGLLESRVIQ